LKNNEENLRKLNFSETGIKRFIDTINEFEDELLNKSINIGKTSQEKDMPLEITGVNVRNAVMYIKYNLKCQKTPLLFIFFNILEYVFTALATFGLAKFDKKYGIILFVLATAIAVILITIRLVNDRR
jgi:hypothetical protein